MPIFVPYGDTVHTTNKEIIKPFVNKFRQIKSRPFLYFQHLFLVSKAIFTHNTGNSHH